MNVIDELVKKGIAREVHDEIHGYEITADKVFHGLAKHKRTGDHAFIISLTSFATNIRLTIVLNRNNLQYLKEMRRDLDTLIRTLEGSDDVIYR